MPFLNPDLVGADIEFERHTPVKDGETAPANEVTCRVTCDGETVRFDNPETGEVFYCDREPLEAVTRKPRRVFEGMACVALPAVLWALTGGLEGAFG